jgi:hypothetical protein
MSYDVMVSSAETVGAFNSGSDTVDMHRLTEAEELGVHKVVRVPRERGRQRLRGEVVAQVQRHKLKLKAKFACGPLRA